MAEIYSSTHHDDDDEEMSSLEVMFDKMSICERDESVEDESIAGKQDRRYIVDLQGLQRLPNIFILKEAAIISLHETTLPIVYHF